MKNGEIFLYNFLVESNNISKKYFDSLSEEVKIETVKDIAATIISNVMEKVKTIDMTLIDRSRGDIKSLRELPVIQEVITELENMLDKAQGFYPECKKALTAIIKSILYINQYSQYFKEAYRNKKTILILKYQSLILSIISATTYLMSVMVDPETNNLNSQVCVDYEIAPIRTLDAFVKSVESGEFKISLRDVAVVRETFVELSSEELGKLLEASDVVNVVADGLKNFYNNLDNGGRVTGLLYKAIGIVILIFSIRDIIYTIARNRTKISDMTAGLQNFINKNGNMKSFFSRFTTGIESSSEIADREISDEDKTVSTQIRQVPKRPIVTADNTEAPAVVAEPAVFDDFDF